MMEPKDRIFNPSRETDRLSAQAERIGPHTFELCETWFNEEGRTGQRRMYGLVNLVRHYAACHVEKAAEIALRNGLKIPRRCGGWSKAWLRKSRSGNPQKPKGSPNSTP
jgi:hypothetical protein